MLNTVYHFIKAPLLHELIRASGARNVAGLRVLAVKLLINCVNKA